MTAMTLSNCALQHKIQVLFGAETIFAYEEGEDRVEVLQLLGEVKEVVFPSVHETNAFLRGLQLALGKTHVLAVDDLQMAQAR